MSRRLALLVALALAGCYQAHEREAPPSIAIDAGRDAPLADTAPIAHDAFVTTETLYTITTGQCFTLATRTIGQSMGPMRCGDFTLEGDFVAYLVGIDGTLCQLTGSFASLDAIPSAPDENGCGRVVNLQIGDGTNLAFLVRVDGHTYRVHVISSTRGAMVFAFDEVG